MDGHFVPNITIGPLVVEACRRATKLPLDVHLMIESPERYIEAFAKAGANSITVHQEACVHLHRTLQQIRAAGAETGVALNPSTPPDTLDYVLEDIDMVLVMSVNPGFGGQKYIPSSARKIARLREMADARGLPLRIEVDGGIHAGTVGEVVKAGADTLVAGSAIFGEADRIAAVRDLRRAAEAR
jgi:ribulose-phosphate 3-epimerase